jgi:hypothetical protein
MELLYKDLSIISYLEFALRPLNTTVMLYYQYEEADLLFLENMKLLGVQNLLHSMRPSSHRSS